jgi:hypothetical protein
MVDRKGAAPAAVLAGAVVLGVPDFARKPVAEQTSLRAQLEALANAAITPLPDSGRIVADADSSLAIVVFEGPKAVLALAERARAAANGLRLRIGINYGPVAAVEDPLRGTCLVGDGPAVALALAGAAAPGQTLASRPFRDAVADASPSLAAALRAAGEITDEDVRSHEVFELDPKAPAVRRRQWAAFAATLAAALLGVGLIARGIRPAPPPPVKPAVLQFKIAPRGEIYLDGKVKGPTPPLSELEVKPGSHVIEVRNSGFRPLRVRVHLAEAEEMTIRHVFVAPKPAPAPPPHKAPHRAPKKEVRKEARREVKKAPQKETAKPGKKDINWGKDIKYQFENVRKKLGF